MIQASVTNTLDVLPGVRYGIIVSNASASIVAPLHQIENTAAITEFGLAQQNTNTEWTIPVGERRWLEFVAFGTKVTVNTSSALVNWMLVRIH